MAIQRVNNALLYGQSSDTKPSSYPNNTVWVETDTNYIYIYESGSWVLAFGPTKTDTLSNKNINASNNTITDTSTAAGDILKSNGTKFVKLARGSNTQVLTSGSSDVSWQSLGVEQTGKATATGDGSTVTFNIAHSVGSNPSVAMVQCSSLINTFTYTTDSTNIIVVFTTAPGNTVSVVFYWRAVA